jgi:hypothetical protein
MQLHPVASASATGEHFVQFYASEAVFATTLERFIVDGLRADEAVIVIATQPHLEEMERRLRSADVDLVAARWRGQYIPVEAEGMLVRIMGESLPDAGSFRAELDSLIAQAGRRKLRGFGEMVSILQARGLHDAVIRLEELWSMACAELGLTLLCAYPRSVFAEDDTDGMTRICANHTHVVVDAVER